MDAVRYINGTRLDDRIIRTDWDAGFIEGRQYGRGKHGGQASPLLLARRLGSLVYSSCGKVILSSNIEVILLALRQFLLGYAQHDRFHD